ncbi:hypothetical protein [Amycolatopsis anabasis]|uniref:hypothetical protein n=1 Tax=Amycolatopsis anabasis TaxID=1840409 RepID=UPI00131C6CF8|nr:hypothetical protein [Amycolatopsis anabasis]
MSVLSELHEQFSAARAKLIEATEHTKRAVDLLNEARKAIVDAHAQAEPWVPPQLDGAIERLGSDADRLSAAEDLVSRYEARL